MKCDTCDLAEYCVYKDEEEDCEVYEEYNFKSCDSMEQEVW